MTNEYRYFLKSNLVGNNRLFVLVYTNQNAINIIVNRKKFYDIAIDCNTKRHEEIGKLTIGQGEDYSTGCLLDYDYIKNHYRLIAADLSRQKELDADPKTIQQIEFVGQLRNLDAIDNVPDAGDNDKSMFVLTITEISKKQD